ncbi:MAG TPA: alpha/beta fold hydrolase, partial [Trueperaceae bacterium]|nr:alpha/beta fold hydrolase [Trueperaceae bacterium]
MPFRLKISLAILALLVVVIFVVPLFIAPGAPAGVKPLAAVAGSAAQYVEIDGVSLHVVRQQPAADPSAEAPLFLLLHGFPFSTATFDDLAPLLADHGEVVAVDLPGFGLSERPLDKELQ